MDIGGLGLDKGFCWENRLKKRRTNLQPEFSDWGEKTVRASREYPTLAAKDAAKMGHPDL
jgi:hypothetical protein